MRAVLCGYYGKGNSGDEALLATLLQMLPEHVHPIVLSGNPAETMARYGVESCDRNSIPAVWNALRQSQAFIFGGGSLIQDSTSLMSPLYYTGLMFLAQRLGLKTIAWAQGIGPLHHSLTRFLARQTFAECHQISVRDAGSAGLLARWQIPALQAPDPVWALTAQSLSVSIPLPTPRVAIALRPHSTLTPARLQVITQALIQFQNKTQTSLLLIPFQPSQDQAIATEIQGRLAGPSQILSFEDPRELKAVFQQVDLTIGMRFHALIMALSEGCPAIALSYDPKVAQLIQALAIPGWELAEIASSSEDRPNSVASTLADQWVSIFGQRQSLDQALPIALRDQALAHRQLLEQALQPQ